MQSLPKAQISLLSTTALSAFWVKRQDTPRGGECNDQASHTPSAGIPVCLPPLADMPEDRHPALRKSVRAAGVAYSDPGIATPSRSTVGAVSAPPTLNAQVKDRKMKSKSFKVGRSAKTGRFTTVKKATQRKSTHVVETVKKK